MTSVPLLPPSEDIAAKRVLVVGDAMLDRYWFGAVERISPEAPVPVVRVDRHDERLGGAANVARNVRGLGARATLMTVLGADEPGQSLRRMLAARGIDATIAEDTNAPTMVKLRVIGRAQQLVRIDFEAQPDHEVLLRLLEDFERALPHHDAVLLSDYGKGGLTHIRRMIELARAAGKPVLVDPKGDDYSRYAGATLMTPNRAELAQVVGKWSDEAALERKARALRDELGLQALVVTRSEEGMSVFDGQGHFRLPAQAREVFDVTGAGDTVIAAFAVLVACGVDLRQAARLANLAGGIVVSRFGTAEVSYDELAQSLRDGERPALDSSVDRQ
jgi:rfaE bifunctional protein kinase chain/domain